MGLCRSLTGTPAAGGAHEADPDADLYYNDYGIPYIPGRSDAVFARVDDFIERGIPIHGIGLQVHVWGREILPSQAQLDSTIAEIVDRGLKVRISELDVPLNTQVVLHDGLPRGLSHDLDAPDEELLQLQKRRYKDTFAGYLALVPPELRGGITMWGVSDAASWHSSPEQPDWPLPFDAEYQPKPAAEGIAEALLGL